MTYEETLAHIYGLRRFGIRPGLERVSSLLGRLGNPHDSLRVVHVAGTNGKGSTAAFLSSILAAGGCRTGLFTSPHLISFTERFRINGTEIDRGDVHRLAQRVMAAAPEGTTFFELVTALALLHFADAGVDCAILEAGMGGGSDATNVASGMLTVITPVALDHSEWLGETIAAIAREKGGIIKAGRPVVLSEQPDEAGAVLVERGRELGCRLCRFDTDFTAQWGDAGLAYRGERSLEGLTPGIGGRYQRVNAATALAAAEILADHGFTLGDGALRRGIAEARWPGRMELFPGAPPILLDGAHNPAGARALAGSLADFPRRRLILVTGIMGDKDADGILAPLLPLVDEVVAVTPAVERGLASDRLASFCRERGVAATDGGAVSHGLGLARQRGGSDDLILVAGSLYTVGEARAALLSASYEPFRG
ncbi:bifunctional folylpolyglutamate synthase/dihydrofolate synthase [Geobacter pickeringii]|uniref:Dihydrofolate synthase/folylpolyglutamate synthase n=1 Tax=Geobacter pickeringii TaxID=345632 RepID=A0A0B5BIQ9_9BACT|nr:folylpolyglutamate synthase/dihydrofolate synthase family protein [Geobacter pickeringii]AJE03936.1 folylpolyglutamate synthase [Geobacter pickeringii]